MPRSVYRNCVAIEFTRRTIAAGPISHVKRTARRRVVCSRLMLAGSSQSRRSADCIIGTGVAPPELSAPAQVSSTYVRRLIVILSSGPILSRCCRRSCPPFVVTSATSFNSSFRLRNRVAIDLRERQTFFAKRSEFLQRSQGPCGRGLPATPSSLGNRDAPDVP